MVDFKKNNKKTILNESIQQFSTEIAKNSSVYGVVVWLFRAFYIFFFCWIPDGEKNILLYIETSVSPFYLHGMKYEMSQACNPLNSQDLSTNVSLL